MFEWIGLIRAVLTLLGSFTQFLHDRQLLSAGEAQAVAAGVALTNAELAKVDAAVAAATADHTAGGIDTTFERD